MPTLVVLGQGSQRQRWHGRASVDLISPLTIPTSEKALAELQAQRVRRRPLHPVEAFPLFPGRSQPCPGREASDIDAARRAAGPSGTRSILDMTLLIRRSPRPRGEPLDDDDLEDVFGRRPRRTTIIVEDDEALFELLERGQGVSSSLYADGKPSEILLRRGALR